VLTDIEIKKQKTTVHLAHRTLPSSCVYHFKSMMADVGLWTSIYEERNKVDESKTRVCVSHFPWIKWF